MPQNIVEVATFTTPLPIPADGDPVDGPGWLAGAQGIANRTKFLNQFRVQGFDFDNLGVHNTVYQTFALAGTWVAVTSAQVSFGTTATTRRILLAAQVGASISNTTGELRIEIDVGAGFVALAGSQRTIAVTGAGVIVRHTLVAATSVGAADMQVRLAARATSTDPLSLYGEIVFLAAVIEVN